MSDTCPTCGSDQHDDWRNPCIDQWHDGRIPTRPDREAVLRDLDAMGSDFSYALESTLRAELTRLWAIEDAAREGCESCEATAGTCAAKYCPHRKTHAALGK